MMSREKRRQEEEDDRLGSSRDWLLWLDLSLKMKRGEERVSPAALSLSLSHERDEIRAGLGFHERMRCEMTKLPPL